MSYGNNFSALLISFTISLRCIIVQFSANILKKGKGRIIFLILCYIKLYRYNALCRYRLFYTNIFIPLRFSVAKSPQSAVHSIIYRIPESSLTIVLSRVYHRACWILTLQYMNYFFILISFFSMYCFMKSAMSFVDTSYFGSRREKPSGLQK